MKWFILSYCHEGGTQNFTGKKSGSSAFENYHKPDHVLHEQPVNRSVGAERSQYRLIEELLAARNWHQHSIAPAD